MWLLVIEIIAAVVASARGWGGKPFAILGGSLVIGFFGGMLFGVDSISCLNIVDIIATIALVVMALVGNERPTPEGANTADTRPCPYCGKRVKREAVICRFCGRDISGTALQNLPLPTTSNWQTGEPLSLPISLQVSKPIEAVLSVPSSGALSIRKRKIIGMETWQIAVLSGMFLVLMALMIGFAVLIFVVK